MKINIKDCKNYKEKFDIKIEPVDTYNLESTLSLIILPALLQFKKNTIGLSPIHQNLAIYPDNEDMNNQYVFSFYSDSIDEANNLAAIEWEKTIDKMIWSFQEIAFPGNSQTFYHVGSTTPNDYWIDEVGLDLYEERIQEGLDLFGKYFRSLWE